jgi:hypothetical protein
MGRKWAGVIVGADPDPAHNDRIMRWAKDYWLALHPHSAGGAYVNFMMDEGPDRVQAAFRDNYERLVLSRPGTSNNFFHINRNIMTKRALRLRSLVFWGCRGGREANKETMRQGKGGLVGRPALS